jgi:hypothetical protein
MKKYKINLTTINADLPYHISLKYGNRFSDSREEAKTDMGLTSLP